MVRSRSGWFLAVMFALTGCEQGLAGRPSYAGSDAGWPQGDGAAPAEETPAPEEPFDDSLVDPPTVDEADEWKSAEGTLTDIDGHPAGLEIRLLFERGIVGGFPDRTYRPSSAVTRAQFAAMLASAFASAGPEPRSSFPDVPSSHWAHEAIGRASRAGFLRGYPDGTFRPNQTISRAEVIAALVSGLRLSGGSWTTTSRRWGDAGAVPTWARNAVATADELGLLSNRAMHGGGDAMGMASLASRAHVASYIHRASQVPDRIPREGEVVVSVLGQDVLQSLEAQLGLGSLFSLHEWGTRRERRNNRDLADNSPWYASLATYVEGEVTAAQRGERTTLEAAGLEPRRLDTRWLTSRDAHFDLIALVNRIDRMDLDPSSCGEIRLLYRLTYRRTDLSPPVSSRMPMTVAVVYDVIGSPGGSGYAGCVEAARSFQVNRNLTSTGEYATWLAERFDGADSRRLRFRQVELNVQAIRIPSESAPELGGQAEYLMRVMAPRAGARALAPIPLPNTPDVSRLQRDPEARERLRRWIVANAADIDRGTAQVPEEFLTSVATAFTTHGSNRRVNHPYSQVFRAEDLSGVSFDGLSTRSREGLLERLDDSTCQGCHMGASVAGFHVLGHDPDAFGHALNRVRLAHSTHYGYELERRQRYHDRLVQNRAPNTRRPLSYLPPTSRRVPAGSPCLGDDRCGGGSSCEVVTSGDAPVNVGMCVRPASRSVGGDPCLSGALRESVSSPRSTSVGTSRFGCGEYACLPPEEGTPAGLCIASCAPGNRERSGDDMCAYNGGISFDTCAASGNFAACLGTSTTRGLRTACDELTPCREDYICQRFVDPAASTAHATGGRGFCVPTYFLFQMRLDGHPRPR
ncbi:MAG: S-layer homology domain-containing protein [Deltaproteobacteria bacterium]|jgi:hypothetical protein